MPDKMGFLLPLLPMVWKPNVTVAAVIRRDNRYLLVEEETDDGIRFNQPAGHLECGEGLVEAAVREVLEETAYHFRPSGLVGIYSWRNEAKDITYLRFAFTGDLHGWEAERELDAGIIAAHWLTLEQIAACSSYHRSPMVRQCIEDHQAGKCYPLDLLQQIG